MGFESVETVYGPMPAYLSCATLQDLCVDDGIQTGPFGSQLHQKDYVPRGTPIITVEHLGENRIVHSNLPQVSDDDKARLSKYVLKTGDIVFSRVGSVDRRALVMPAEDGWLFSGRCLRVRPDVRLLDARWLSYFFGLPAFKNYIRGIAVGATMPSINTKILSDIPIYFPGLAMQREAALILAQLAGR
ncbi:restriction endonuclease subunit S [Pseudomonas mendocina]|nr:restriction endonuclease subunit S [Pseudomonas mendocina]MDV5862538.1 restriction endonuclease subunit S [Pseudomonas mendocina]